VKRVSPAPPHSPHVSRRPPSLHVEPAEAPESPSDEPLAAAFRRLAPLLEDTPDLHVPAGQLVAVNTIATAGAVEALLPGLLRHREALAQMPGFDLSWLDELRTLCRATLHAAARAEANRRPRAIGQLLTEIRADRLRFGRLVNAHRALAGAPPYPLRLEARSASHVALSVQALAQELRTLGIGGMPIDEPALQAAEARVRQLLETSVVWNATPLEVIEARKLRTKLLSLLLAVYGEVRLAVLWVGRYERNIDRVAPNLGAGARAARKKTKTTRATKTTKK
jgi:hypothetical protein